MIQVEIHDDYGKEIGRHIFPVVPRKGEVIVMSKGESWGESWVVARMFYKLSPRDRFILDRANLGQGVRCPTTRRGELMAEWETVALNTDRLEVPGGWIYRWDTSSGPGRQSGFIFIPEPPHLVDGERAPG